MQKTEVITIRTNSDIKKMVEEAKLNSGQTASDWLEQAVLAWSEKHDTLVEDKRLDSVHILAGRKALTEVSKVLEALENAGKQTIEICKKDSSNWQTKYSQLEDLLAQQENEKKLLNQKLAVRETEIKKQLAESEQLVKKLQAEINSYQAHETAIKEVTQCLEQERSISLRLHKSKEDLEQNFQELERKYNKLTLESESNNNFLVSLRERAQLLEQETKQLQLDLNNKEKENIKLNLSSKYIENTLAQLQASIDTQNLQIKDLQAENLNLLTQKSELVGQINMLKETKS